MLFDVIFFSFSHSYLRWPCRWQPFYCPLLSNLCCTHTNKFGMFFRCEMRILFDSLFINFFGANAMQTIMPFVKGNVCG